MSNPANSTAYRSADGRMYVDVTENKTLAIDDSGYVQNVIFDNAVITLPDSATTGFFIVRNGGVPATSGPAGSNSNGTAKVSVSPTATDKIQGGVTGTATDNKDLINTKATSKIGDEVALMFPAQATGADVPIASTSDGPVVAWIKGIWARE